MTTALEQLAIKVGDQLQQHRLKLATAESCTGGGLSYWITSVSGSSDWFERGFVTYSNEAKTEMLGVNPKTIETYGAVSKETAHEMAEGVLRHSRADISIAITGIAGPLGGSEQKPVGTVWIAWARGDAPLQVESYLFSGNREAIRISAMTVALEKLSDFINKPLS